MTSVRRGRQSNESKELSRQRLLQAALDILDAQGESALTTGSVTKAAGLAQPSFYVHFTNMDELLETLLAERFDGWWDASVEARRIDRSTPGTERFADTLRIPIEGLISEPQLFRVVIRNRHDDRTRLGAWSVAWFAERRTQLVADLREAGFPGRTAKERRRLEMIADGVMSMTAELVEGHLQGRYPDVDQIIDVLTEFSIGYTNTPRVSGT